jgi:hypothetical protein
VSLLFSIDLVVERARALTVAQNASIGPSGIFGVVLVLLGCFTLVIGTAPFSAIAAGASR